MDAEPINAGDSTHHTPAASQAPCEPSDPAACPTISAQQIHTRASEPILTPATIQTAPPFARASSTCSVRNRGNEQNPSHQRPSAARPSIPRAEHDPAASPIAIDQAAVSTAARPIHLINGPDSDLGSSSPM
ncbi:hypothetical protein ACLOJK_041234 [Asimina triloba]